MKPASFEYVRPSSVEETLTLLADVPDAMILAGGQSLVPMLNMRLVAPSHVIDIGALSELGGISLTGDRLRIGSLVRHCDLVASEEVTRATPLLQEGARHIGHPAIRNRGTVGGSLAHADPAAELPGCLLALDGVVEIAGPDGVRKETAEEFFVGAFETKVGNNELLLALEVPATGSGYRSNFAELARRHGDYALAGLAAHARIDQGCAYDLRLAFFGVSDRPVLAVTMAAHLEGVELSAVNIKDAVAFLGKDCDVVGQPGCSAETKQHLCAVLARRVLSQLAA